VICGGGSPRARRRLTRLSESIWRAVLARLMFSRRDSRVSMPCRAKRISD
jgi:hypothetical protein